MDRYSILVLYLCLMRASIDKGIVKRRCLQINFGCAYIQETLQLLPEGVSINECILSLFLEYWCEVAPVLDFECAYVPD